MVLRGEITTEKLTAIYDTINRIIKNKNCYYEDQEIGELKEKEGYIFIKSSNTRN